MLRFLQEVLVKRSNIVSPEVFQSLNCDYLIRRKSETSALFHPDYGPSGTGRYIHRSGAIYCKLIPTNPSKTLFKA